ncbi:MAG: hypothetical protein SRB2_00894 [Desulfobacteraceae bacterium Eth-SRB2]|nr:MAG: hypothetical protein SRB2_00894 [Desulfobacteraceae bacterium Eth-SRB2]
MLLRKDQKSSTSTENLKGSEEIATSSSSKTGADVEKKSFLDMTTLIRSIQRAEGNTDCFQRGIIDCDQVDCKWRSFCLEEQPFWEKTRHR